MSTATEDYIAHLEAEIARLEYELAVAKQVPAPTLDEALSKARASLAPPESN